MLPLELFRNSTYTGANLVVLLVALAMFGVFFFVSLYMQNILGYSAVQAGAAFLPLTVLIILVAPIAGRTSDRIGSRGLMTAGMILVATQLVLFSRLSIDSTFWNLLPGMLIGGVGMALTMTPSAAAATRGVPVDKAGVGSAVLNSARQVGGTMGVAILGAIMASEIGGEQTPEAFMRGFERALLVAAGIAVVGAVVAYALVRPHEEAGRRARARDARACRQVALRQSLTLEGRRAIHSPVGQLRRARARQEGRGHAGGNSGFSPRTRKRPRLRLRGRFPFEATPSRGGEPANRGSAAQPRSSCARRPIRRWCPRIRSGVRSSAVWA